MNDTYIYETEIINVVAYPFDTELFYAIAFLFTFLILFVAYSRRKYKEESPTFFGQINNYDVLSLPVETLTNDRFPKEGVLFNNASKMTLLMSFIYCFLSVILFGILVFSLNFFFVNQVSCVI